MRTWLTAAFLGIASFAFFATGITNPGDTLFDEKLYVDAGNAVLAGTTDPSPYGPPLGKLIVAASIHLFGNNAFGWRGLAALLFCLRRFARTLPETLIVSLYAVNMLQWAFTPQSCTFYYYYFPAAMFLGMAIPIALCRIPSHYFGVRLSVVCVLPALCVFAFCFAHMAHLGAPYDTMLGYWP
jgi:hypothetical protein